MQTSYAWPTGCIEAINRSSTVMSELGDQTLIWGDSETISLASAFAIYTTNCGGTMTNELKQRSDPSNPNSALIPLPLEAERYGSDLILSKCEGSFTFTDPECSNPPFAKTFKIVIVVTVGSVVDAS